MMILNYVPYYNNIYEAKILYNNEYKTNSILYYYDIVYTLFIFGGLKNRHRTYVIRSRFVPQTHNNYY